MAVPQRIDAQTGTKTCRFCGAGLQRTFVDLGMSPLCETYPSAAELNRGEVYYPLHVYICETCWLVQLEEYESAESIFLSLIHISAIVVIISLQSPSGARRRSGIFPCPVQSVV